jgi:HPt (histidine-containing phosphotransfer) domain-containing protein
MTLSTEILAELEALRESFRLDAREQAAGLARRWTSLKAELSAAGSNPGGVEALAAEAHRLAGTAGTFALGALAAAAHALEIYLESQLDEPAEAMDTHRGDLLVAEIMAALA